jgi:hypothetical protein
MSLPLGDLVGIGKELPANPFGLWEGFAGDPGRLMNVLTTGVIGVLDGLSIDTAKFLCGGDADGSPLRKSCAVWLSGAGILLVGTEGREKARFSSNSSMEGKACVNSDRLKEFSCGEDVGVEDGEGGPREEGGTKVWGDGAEEAGAEGAREDGFIAGEDSRIGEFGGLGS